MRLFIIAGGYARGGRVVTGLKVFVHVQDGVVYSAINHADLKLVGRLRIDHA